MPSSPDAAAAPGRPYGGRAPDQRREERHQRLLAAGLSAFADVGWDDATIGLLCSTARVGTRAFYEHVASREALLLEIATAIVLEGVERLTAAVAAAPPVLEDRVRAGLSAYVGFLVEDPRRVRVTYAAVPRAGALTADRHRASQGFADLIAGGAEGLELAPRAVGNPLLALALTGAVGELLGWWAAQDDPPPVDDVVEELVQLFLRALSP